jgi:guanine nucleotide-binding protein subunit gamma
LIFSNLVQDENSNISIRINTTIASLYHSSDSSTSASRVAHTLLIAREHRIPIRASDDETLLFERAFPARASGARLILNYCSRSLPSLPPISNTSFRDPHCPFTTIRSTTAPQRGSLPSPPQQIVSKQNPRIHITLDDSPERLASRRAEQRFDSTAAIMSAAPYEIRTNDNGRSRKQSMAELKLRRLTELNQRLQEDLNRRRIPVSEAAVEYVSSCRNRVARRHWRRRTWPNVLRATEAVHVTQNTTC